MAEDKKQLTERQEAFLDALFNEAGGDVKKAMSLAGYSPNTRSHEATKALREEIVERASMYLSINAPKAVNRLVGVLDDPGALGNKNTIAAAKEVLDRIGIVKKEYVEVKSTGNAVFILPPKNSEDE